MNPEGYVVSGPRGSWGGEAGREGAWNDLKGLERCHQSGLGAGHLGMCPKGLVTGSQGAVFILETRAALHPTPYLPILHTGCDWW